MTDPMMLLGQLHARVTNLEGTSTDTNTVVNKIANDLQDMKLQAAVSAGRKESILSAGRIVSWIIMAGTSIGTAWATVKSILPEIPHGH